MDSKTTAASITRDEVARLLGAMVSIPSINPFYREAGAPVDWFGEARLADYIAGWLRAEGIEAELDEAMPGRPNVVARLKTGPGAPTMIWEGHTDTVQVDGMAAPFTPRIEGNRLYGRGAVDDKGCLAMFMLAMRALKRHGCAYDLTFVAAVDEEVTFEGVLHHVRTHAPYDLGIAGEPTNLAVVSACKGVIRFHIEITGRGAHASKPEEAIDALMVSADLLRHLDSYIAKTSAPHSMLGHRTLTCTKMQAGEGANTVPAHARLLFDFRVLPDQTGNEAWDEIAAVVRDFSSTHPAGATVEIRRPFIDSISMEVPGDAQIIREMTQVLAGFGLPSETIAAPFGSDATKMTRAGTPTVVFGPGSIEQAHSNEEHVDMDEVVRAAEILVALAIRRD